MSRIWNLRLNLDTLNALYTTAYTDGLKGEAFTGLMIGLNGGLIPEQCSSIVRSSFDIGCEMRAEAMSYVKSKAEAGKKSAERRKGLTGSSRPTPHEHCSSSVRTDPEQCSNSVQGVFEECSRSVRTNLQSTIYNLQSNNSTNESAAPKRAAKRKEMPTPPEDLIPFLVEIISRWPKKTVYKNSSGQPYRVDVGRLATPQHLWSRILKFCPGEDPKLAMNCAFVYLEEREKVPVVALDGKDYPPNICFMTNFYGEKGLWKTYLTKLLEE